MTLPDGPGAAGDGLVVRLRTAGCVFAEDEAEQLRDVFPAGPSREAAVRRREQGVPLEHVVGFAVFAGVRVALDPGVFVPRPRAEPLVEIAVAAAREQPTRRQRRASCVVDLGCGSGAIAAALSTRLASGSSGSGARAPWGRPVVAVDSDPVAVACARRNGVRHGFAAYRGDWFAALPLAHRDRVDVAVAYLPHVPTASLAGLSADYRAAEPLTSVHGGDDGLDPLRAVLGQAPRWLRPDGAVVTMSAPEQEPGVAAVADERGWRVRTRMDPSGGDDVFYELSRSA